ncbi:histone-like nucleoid-structuring protein Lsr2 [Klenkia terrae]|uniref:ERCC4 domain-containing protein n=1 Tax=Klenkia terrae TaxID=1052259 RepID=UPI00360C9FEE
MTTRRRLAAGDYAVLRDGEVLAAVERKTLADLVTSLRSGKLTYAMAELSALPRSAVVVEDRYSRLFSLEHWPGAAAAEALAEAQARFPAVPVVFCETRPLAQEWTYRWLGACQAELAAAADTAGVEQTFAPAGPVPVPAPTPAQVRRWARAEGIDVSDRGRVPAELTARYLASRTASTED